MANKKISTGVVSITATPPHLQFLSPLVVSITASKIVELSSINLNLVPPVSIELKSLVIDILNKKYVQLSEILFNYGVDKFSTIAALNYTLYPPRQNEMAAIDIWTKMLRSYDFGSVNVDLVMEPTRTRYHGVNIQAMKIPKKSIMAFEISTGFPYETVDIKVPLTTYWARNLKTEVSGALETYRRAIRANVATVYSSAVEYLDVPPQLSRFSTQVRAATSKTHKMKTDIFLDYDTWFTRYEWMNTNMVAAGTNVHQMANHLFTLGGNTKALKTNFMGKDGIYVDNLPVPEKSLAYADIAGKQIWLKQQYQLGYTVLTKQINYGVLAQFPVNISGVTIDSAYLGIPLVSPRVYDVTVTVNLLQVNSIDFSQYFVPSEILNVYGAAFGVSGTITTGNTTISYIDITELLKRFQQIYTTGTVVIQIVPSTNMIYADMLSQKPFLYRVVNIDMNGSYIMKIFTKRSVIG